MWKLTDLPEEYAFHYVLNTKLRMYELSFLPSRYFTEAEATVRLLLHVQQHKLSTPERYAQALRTHQLGSRYIAVSSNGFAVALEDVKNVDLSEHLYLPLGWMLEHLWVMPLEPTRYLGFGFKPYLRQPRFTFFNVYITRERMPVMDELMVTTTEAVLFTYPNDPVHLKRSDIIRYDGCDYTVFGFICQAGLPNYVLLDSGGKTFQVPLSFICAAVFSGYAQVIRGGVA